MFDFDRGCAYLVQQVATAHQLLHDEQRAWVVRVVVVILADAVASSDVVCRAGWALSTQAGAAAHSRYGWVRSVAWAMAAHAAATSPAP